ncbi:MAG TPA: PAS domain S-box protein [Pyrinomonadaceae bacterium]
MKKITSTPPSSVLTNEQTRLQTLHLQFQAEMEDRKRFEEAVKTNEALLRLFIKHTPAAIAMFDTEMRYLQVSDRFLTDYDLEGQDIIGKSHYEVFPNIPERWKEVHKRILAGAVERCEEEPYITADGSTGWLQWESLPWRKGNGEIGGLILFTQVITERKRAEEALRASEERFSKIFNLSPFRMGILRIRDGVVLEVNDAWTRDTGFSRNEIINQPIFALSSMMDDSLAERIRDVLTTRQPVSNMEVRFTAKDGRAVIANTSAVIIDLDGEPCYLWVANDITERKHAEEALKASESRFSIAFNSNPMLASISMLEGGRFLAVNDSFVALTGYSREEAVGHTALELNLWPNPEDRRRVMEKLKKETRVRDFEAAIRLKSGEERVLLLSIEKIELDGQLCLLHVADDITLRKRAEEALRALSARLRSAREEEGARIAREIHDELGGALTGLKWDLEKIDTTLNSLTDGLQLAELRNRIGSMTTLIETTINTVRRIAAELRPGVLDDLGLVAAIEWQIEQFQSRSGLKCHWTNNAKEIELDREKATAVFRILQEILTNVLRHAEATNLYVKLGRNKHYFEVEVKDDGRGITESQRMNPRSLGLLGMKERALLVGGEVRVTGKEGAGTTVVVRVPI